MDGDDVSRSLLQKGREKKNTLAVSHCRLAPSIIIIIIMHNQVGNTCRRQSTSRWAYQVQTSYYTNTNNRPHEAWSSGRLCAPSVFHGLRCAKKTTVTMVSPSSKAYRDQLAQRMHVRVRRTENLELSLLTGKKESLCKRKEWAFSSKPIFSYFLVLLFSLFIHANTGIFLPFCFPRFQP